MLNRRRLGSGTRAEGRGGESASFRGQRDMPGLESRLQESQGSAGKPEQNEAGMFIRINDMPICDPHQGFGEQERKGLRAEGCWENKPKRPKIRCSQQIQGFRPKQTQSSYLSCHLSATGEIGPFFSKFECERSIKDSVLKILDAPSRPSIAERARVARAGGGPAVQERDPCAKQHMGRTPVRRAPEAMC